MTGKFDFRVSDHTRGKIARMGTLLVERRSPDALAVAEDIHRGLPDLTIEEWFETPQLMRFRFNHATLLLRRGAVGDAARARQMIMDLADHPVVHNVELDPVPVVLTDDVRARALPSLPLALNRFGQHERAAQLGERLIAAHRTSTERYHRAVLNTALCWSAHGLALWCGGRGDEAAMYFAKAIEMLQAEVAAGAPFLSDSHGDTQDASVLLRESNLCYVQLWHLVAIGNVNDASLDARLAAAQSFLDRSERNATVGPVCLSLRYSRLGEVFVERASHAERAESTDVGALAMAALVYFSARWQIYTLDNDLPLSVALRYAEARRLADEPNAARLVLERTATQLRDRCGADYPGFTKIADRLARLADVQGGSL